MSKIEYAVPYSACDYTSLQLDRYISTSPKRTTLLAITKYMSRPKSAAVKDIDIDDILGQKYRYRIDICNIDPPLIVGLPSSVCFS